MRALLAALLSIFLISGDAFAACTSPAGEVGEIIYNVDHDTFQGCAGSEWKVLTLKKGPGSLNVNFGFLHAGGGYNCKLVSGNVYCWGTNASGQLGTGDNVSSPSPVQVSGGHAFKQISAGYTAICGVTTAGQALCWGAGTSGKLGNGDSLARNAPTPVVGGHTFKSIYTSGDHHTCGITTTNDAYCWGANSNGQSGINSTLTYGSPQAVHGGHKFAQIVGGYRSTCGLTTTGDVYCWGRNDYDHQNRGSTGYITTPVGPIGTHKFIKLSMGNYHVCGLKADNTLWCWGYGSIGQLGQGDNANQSLPTQVPGSYKDFTCGYYHTCAVSTAGDAYCFGQNSYGHLGVGDTTNRNTPTLVLGGHKYKEISASSGNYHTCAVAIDDTNYCWGNNSAYQLGDGTNTQQTSPVAVIWP